MIKITNTADAAIVELFGDIGDSWFSDGWTLEKFKEQLKGVTTSNLIIQVKSLGGDVFEAFSIYDEIRRHSARVTVVVVGSSASAATIISCAADHIRISENSRYLVHNARTFVDGNKESLKEAFEQLVSIDNQILDIYVKRTGKSKEVLAELMKEEKWMTAAEALEWGFVDEIEKSVTNKYNKKMKKFNNMTPEELEEMDQLVADNEALVANNKALEKKVAELEAQLAEMTAAAEKTEEEQIEKEIEAAIETGKIKAEVKKVWFEIGKKDRTNMTAAIEAIYTTSTSKLVDVPKSTTPTKVDKKSLWSAWKKGEITLDKYNEELIKINKN